MMNLRVASFGRLSELLPSYLGLAMATVIGLIGTSALVEMVYHLQLNAAMGPELSFLGIQLMVNSVGSWFGAAAVLATGAGLFEVVRRGFARRWSTIQTFIEAEMKRREVTP